MKKKIIKYYYFSQQEYMFVFIHAFLTQELDTF